MRKTTKKETVEELNENGVVIKRTIIEETTEEDDNNSLTMPSQQQWWYRYPYDSDSTSTNQAIINTYNTADCADSTSATASEEDPNQCKITGF